ncbi:MAG: hypothetical protein ACE5NA_10395 [Nitrospiraceae bacterium]
MRQYKRRRVLVDTFQYRLLGVNLLYFLTVLLVFAATLFVPLMVQLDSGTLDWRQRQQVATEFLSLHTRVWPSLLVTFVLLTIHSVFVSHRIAGPLYQFRTLFKLIAQGNLSVRATIRKRDYLRKDAESINEMIAALETRITGIEEQYEEAHGALTKLRRAIDSSSVGGSDEQIKNLELQMERLKVCVNQFRTAGERLVGDNSAATKGGSVSQALGTQ